MHSFTKADKPRLRKPTTVIDHRSLKVAKKSIIHYYFSSTQSVKKKKKGQRASSIDVQQVKKHKPSPATPPSRSSSHPNKRLIRATAPITITTHIRIFLGTRLVLLLLLVMRLLQHRDRMQHTIIDLLKRDRSIHLLQISAKIMFHSAASVGRSVCGG